MNNTYYVTQSQQINVKNKSHTIATPDIFGKTIAGDVFKLNLSLSLSEVSLSEETSLELTLLNDYSLNKGGSVKYIIIKPESVNQPFFSDFSPIEYTVLENGVPPMDRNLVHIEIKVLKGNLSEVTLNSRSIWEKVQWIKL